MAPAGLWEDMGRSGPSKCHPERESYSGGVCNRCYYQANKDRFKAAHRKYYERNRPKLMAAVKAWRAANPDKVREMRRRSNAKCLTPAYWLKTQYGMTVAEYEAMLSAQGNKCRICALPFKARATVGGPEVDHDHATNRVRGLLCHHCNKLLGHAKDNPQILTNAAYYLMTQERRRAAQVA